MDSQVTLQVDGRPVALRLNLSALSKIEDALKADTLVSLAARLANPSAGQLIQILTILAEAADVNDVIPDMGRAQINLKDAMRQVMSLFQTLLAGEGPGKPLPDNAAGPSGSASPSHD